MGEGDADVEIVSVSGAAELERWAAAWDDLAREASEPNVFYESWMLIPAVKYLSRGVRLEFLFLRDRTDGGERRLLGFFPLLRRRRYKRLPLRFVSTWQYVHCYLCAPLVRRGSEERCFTAFFDWLAAGGGSMLLINEFDQNGAVYAALRGCVQRQRLYWYEEQFERALLLKTSSNAKSYIGSILSKNFRKEMRRKRNRIAELGEMEFQFTEEIEDVDCWIADFLALEASGWKGRQGTALQCTEENRAFVYEIVRSAAQRDQLMLASARLDGKLIASGCQLLTGRGGFAFKIAYDEEYGRLSPGVLLELEHIKHCYELKELEWLDSCASSDSQMANRLWSGRKTISSAAAALHLLPAGLMLCTAAPLVRRFRRRVVP